MPLKLITEQGQQSLSAAGGVLMTAILREQDLRSPITFYLVSLTRGLLMGEGKETSPLSMGRESKLEGKLAQMCECEGGAKRTHPWGYSCIVVGAVAVHSQLLPAS